MSALDAELAIVGGGLVGASLALAAARRAPRLRLLLLDPGPTPPAAPPAWDERCIALNAASQRFFADLDLWPRLEAVATPITATHISERGRFGRSLFRAEEAGLPALGYNVPLRAVAEAIEAACARHGLRRLAAAVEAVDPEADAARLRLADGQRLRVALVAAADGSESAVRRALGLQARSEPYGQQALVTAVRVSRPQPGVAYERFLPSGPIALLPKGGDACSLIWTLPTLEAERCLALDEASFLAEAEAAFGGRLGRFTALGRRVAYPLQRVLSERLAAARSVFLGNAAHTLHPVAAQGFNLGLRDVAALAALLASAPDDPGAAALTEAYAAAREADHRRTAAFTDGLVRLFSNHLPGLAQGRSLGLLGLDLLGPVKKAVLWQNLGYGGSR